MKERDIEKGRGGKTEGEKRERRERDKERKSD